MSQASPPPPSGEGAPVGKVVGRRRPGPVIRSGTTRWRRLQEHQGAAADLDGQPSSRIFRVIGQPGETISIRRKTVSINGSELDDPWAVHRDDVVYDARSIFPRRSRMRDNLSPLAIPDDAVFVMGDNRDESYASRFLGPVRIADLSAEARFVYWSGQRYGRIGTRLR